MEKITLRRIGGSLYFRMPPRFVHMHSLSEGDAFFIVQGKNGATLNFIKEEVVAGEIVELVEKAIDVEEVAVS